MSADYQTHATRQQAAAKLAHAEWLKTLTSEARKTLQRIGVLDAPDDSSRDISRHAAKGLRVWSRGNSYDLAILKLAYQRTGRELPWNFWMERDVRTWLEGCQFKSSRKNNHCALDDACNQAADIHDATRSGYVDERRSSRGALEANRHVRSRTQGGVGPGS